MKWRTFNGEQILSIKDAVEQAIVREQKAGNRLKVCIGTDSQVYSSNTEFATVIVFLREKRGGFMYVHTESAQNRMSLKERMITEVAKSVHADINSNPQFESNVALKEAIGYIMGMGFAFKVKPDAFASSSCADKLV